VFEHDKMADADTGTSHAARLKRIMIFIGVVAAYIAIHIVGGQAAQNAFYTTFYHFVYASWKTEGASNELIAAQLMDKYPFLKCLGSNVLSKVDWSSLFSKNGDTRSVFVMTLPTLTEAQAYFKKHGGCASPRFAEFFKDADLVEVPGKGEIFAEGTHTVTVNGEPIEVELYKTTQKAGGRPAKMIEAYTEDEEGNMQPVLAFGSLRAMHIYYQVEYKKGSPILKALAKHEGKGKVSLFGHFNGEDVYITYA
jgi:hypothetical protein